MNVRNVKRFLVALLTICILLTQGNMVAFALEKGDDSITTIDESTTGVQFYKNNTFMGTYDTINDAFDMMTDTTADYQIVLLDDQVLEGYAQWPKANSIKIMPVLNNAELGYATTLYLKDEKTTFHSDVCLSDWICVMPYVNEIGESITVEVDLQDYTLTCTEELAGHNVTLGNPGTTANAGLNFVGDEGSKMVVENTTQLWHSSLRIDTLELVHHAQDEWASAGITLYYPRQDSTINSVISQYCAVNPIEVRGYTDLKSKLVIGDIQFAEPVVEPLSYEFNIRNEGNIDVEIQNAAENMRLEFTYWSKCALETSTFSYTGTEAPESINVWYYMHSQGGAMGPTDVEGITQIPEDAVLLYAPYVSSDIITFHYSMQNTMHAYSYHSPYYDGSWESEDGYYGTKHLPKITPSDVVFVVAEDCEKELTYTGVNPNGDLKSVTWTVYNEDSENGYVRTDVTDQVVKSYDEDSVTLSLEKLDESMWTTLSGEFEYEHGTLYYHVPIVYSVPATDVYFTESEKTVEFYAGRRVTLELNYTAEEDPVIIITNTDYNVLYAFALDGNTLSFIVTEEGTAIVRAYVGGEVAECKVIVGSKEDEEPISKGWQQDEHGWKYQKEDGTYVTNCWYQIDGQWYAFDANSYMREGWFNDGGTWYFLNYGSGTMATGWVNDGGTWYYMHSSGAMATGWVQDGSTWYYMHSSGAMTTGWVQDGGTWYYMHSSGAMATGWTQVGGTWYYMHGNGAMATGWLQDGGTWYYMHGSGAMATGWVQVDGTWYYMHGSGAMATGWIMDGGNWYYMHGSGAMATGWIMDGGNWYYLYENGVMARNTWIGDCYVDDSGVWVY